MTRVASIVTRLAPFAVVALALVSAGPANPAVAGPKCAPKAANQCIVIETRIGGKHPVLSASTGPFSLAVRGAGPLESDSGKALFWGTRRGRDYREAVHNGQSVVIYNVTTTWQGKLGTFVLREKFEASAAGSGYAVNTGVWSIVRTKSTGQYAGLSGSGGLASVVTRKGLFSRYEGLVGQP